ncbi:hypothetical protein HDK64DRAFT_254192 [Phyllosticta capitalensis]
MRATPLLIAIATLLSLTFASALPTAESNIPIPSSTLRTHIRAASTPPPAATPANAAATPAATGATCFDDGDCILSRSREDHDDPMVMTTWKKKKKKAEIVERDYWISEWLTWDGVNDRAASA